MMPVSLQKPTYYVKIEELISSILCPKYQTISNKLFERKA